MLNKITFGAVLIIGIGLLAVVMDFYQLKEDTYKKSDDVNITWVPAVGMKAMINGEEYNMELGFATSGNLKWRFAARPNNIITNSTPLEPRTNANGDVILEER